MNELNSNVKSQDEIDRMSFEDALAELEQIVRQLEAGGQALEGAIDNYSYGTALKTHCEKKLQEAKLKVEKLVVGNDGNLSTEPLQVD